MTQKLKKSDERKQEKSTGLNLFNSYAQLPEVLFSRLSPRPVSSPTMVIFNRELAYQMGLDPEAMEGSEGVELLAGNQIPEGADPIAQAYAGHQFGHFNKLGDGRAILLGEHRTPEGKWLDVQLKGSGKTPYSRQGDGRATLGPMLREYVISEAMYGLGIPTSRSLAVVSTGERVFRERPLPGAVLSRVASSHLRVGTFQYAAAWGDEETLRRLVNYTWNRHFSHKDPGKNKAHSLLMAVIQHQASLIAKWQLTGFVHGVMNTDNMTISGETIDYGPCAFMDRYHPATVFSSIDHNGRYAYGNQPTIAGWNLARFAETLLPLIHEKEASAVEIAQQSLEEYSRLFRKDWLKGFRRKLGMIHETAEDIKLIEDLFQMMEKKKMDFTNTFRSLTIKRMAAEEKTVVTKSAVDTTTKEEEMERWIQRWNHRLEKENQSSEEIIALMKASNPAIIPRNHRVEAVLESAVQHQTIREMEKLLEVLKDPYAYTEEQENYADEPSASALPYRTYCGT